MNQSKDKGYILTAVIICVLTMSWIDGVVQPGYVIKSGIKILLFLLVPMLYYAMHRERLPALKRLFIPGKSQLPIALGLGAAVYGLILGGYYVLNSIIDLTDMILSLTAQGGVSAENFLLVSLYISFVNSFLEEFLFRGFAFISLKEQSGRGFAYLFSAVMFALYHFGMFAGSVNIPIWILAMAGLTAAGVVLNWLNEKSGNIYLSWIVHMFANFGINTVGFMIFGMI